MNHSFQVGGSVSPQLSVYIPRAADDILYQSLHAGELCYVFNSRQMGKSSLLLNVKTRLITDGFKCCFIDISRIGSVNITSEQWYAGIISELWRGFNLPSGQSLIQWWNSLGDLPAPHKLSLFLEEKLIETYPDDEFVLFFDEVDSVISLPFPADDFFSVMRACYNRRAEQQRLTKIRFALFGVAVPSDLIKEPSRSPFNIGKAIRLEGFSLRETQPFANNLPFDSEKNLALLAQVIKWGNGQPFLTQKLCQLIVNNAEQFHGDSPSQWFDELMQSKVLDNWESHDNPEHLRTIKDRILVDQEHGTQVLVNYLRVLQSPNQVLPVTELEEFSRLYLTGLIAIDGQEVTPRTRIYRTIFSEKWVEQQLNSQRPYGQKIALWRASHYLDNQWLLQGDELNQAKNWASNRILPDIDHRYLSASQDKVNDQVKAWNDKLQVEIEQRKAAQQQLLVLNQEIQKAKQEADKANKAKSDFLARVSHEVRTHINSVLGLSYLAQKGEQSRKSRRHLQKINQAGNYMLGVVNDIVDINKVEKGQLSLTLEPFYLDAVVDRLIDTVSFTLHETGLQLFLHMPSTPLPALYGDPKRLEQLLTNLISNAIKHTHDGTITFSIDLLDNQQNQELDLSFSVLDTGVGIAEHEVDDVIVGEDNSPITLGIGLRLCTELTKLMRGELKVHSTPEQGTQFTFNARFPKVGKPYTANTQQQVYIQHDPRSTEVLNGLRGLGHHVDSIDITKSLKGVAACKSVFLFNAIAFKGQAELLELIGSAPQVTLLPVVNTGDKLPHWLQVLGLKQVIEYPCTAVKLDRIIQACFHDNNAEELDSTATSIARILVAEDDEINQEIIKELLTSKGCHVDIVGNGVDAIERVKQHSYDIVFMDIEMPKMGGVEAVEAIRVLGKQENYQRLLDMPIVAMTAHALIEDKKRFIKAGMNDHIAKPLEPSVIFQVIQQWSPSSEIDENSLAVDLDSQFEPIINGIDTAAGLVRCNGNHKLYISILEQFAHKHLQGFVYADMDIFQLTKRCHAIKGSAANIGANVISRLAAEIETLGRTGVFAEDKQLIHFSNALMMLSQNICNIVGRIKEAAPNVISNNKEIADGLKRFLQVIENDHGEASTIMSELMVFNEPSITDISQSMAIFDTDKAMAQANQWLNDYKRGSET